MAKFNGSAVVLFFIGYGRAMRRGKTKPTKHRLAIVDPARCKPQKCHQECRKSCPVNGTHDLAYPELHQQFDGFALRVTPGHCRPSSITVLLGENGTGKSTFIRLLVKALATDDRTSRFSVSVKPQTIHPKFPGTVRALFDLRLGARARVGKFKRDVIVPLNVERFLDTPVRVLSGGELQRVALCLALGKKADVYLIDEPSAFLDSEQRMAVAKVLKRFVLQAQKMAFVVEHDMMMAAYLADQVIVFEGEPARQCVARAPEPLITGMNRFLRMLNVTFRRDTGHTRPRINKLDSVKDREQKAANEYFKLV